MKKKMRRVLSVFLSVFLLVSLFQGTALAAGNSAKSQNGTVASTTKAGKGSSKTKRVSKGGTPADAPGYVEENADAVAVDNGDATTEVSYPAISFADDSLDGMVVTVDAPEGAFPANTTMRVATPSSEAIDAALGAVDNATGAVAVDITFIAEDQITELQPLVPISVKIDTTDLDEAETYALVHVDSADNATVVDEENIETIDNTGAEFTAAEFSVYAIIAKAATGTAINLSALEEAADAIIKAAPKAPGDISISAGKTVTDNDGDGIYELALNVKATSDQSSSAKVTKSNIVMIIDVSGSMDYRTPYTYDSSTYNSSDRYYSSSSTNSNSRVYYSNGAWYDSYGYRHYGTVYETRMQATKRAANAVVDALLAYNVNDDNITDVFEITVVKFSSRAQTSTVIRDSVSATAIKNAINNLSADGGTHWRAALEQGLREANYFKNSDPSTDSANPENTSVVFLTDGFPTMYGSGDDYYSADNHGENNGNVSRAFLGSLDSARDIIANGYSLYSIFAYGNDTTKYGNSSGNYSTGGVHSGYEFLCGLTNYAYGSGNNVDYSNTAIARQHCFNAKSTADLIAAFNTIINHITNNVGYAGVNLSDGVSLGATSTSVAVNGTAKAETMRYTVTDDSGKIAYTVKIDKDGKATFTIRNADGTETTLTDDSPDTVEKTINGTTITSQVYKVTVGSGDDAKDYMISPATINANNGMVKWDLAGLGILESGYTYTVAFDVWPNQLAYDIAADLNNGIYEDVEAALDAYNITDDTDRQHIIDALVHNDDGSYSLYTNYSQQIEYYPATETIDDQGNSSWTYGDKQTQDLKQPDPIPLKGSLLPLTKAWEAGLSPEEYNELLWEDGIEGGTSKKYQITLYVWKADTVKALEDKISAGVSADNEPYITKVLGWDEQTNSYDFSKEAAVAPGTMVNVDEAEKLGFDITDQTKLREFNGTTYYVIESGHYYQVTEEGSDLHFELESDLYHPMIVDGTLYNVFFGDGKTVTKMDPMASVTATNTLKGGLNISKVVSSTQIAVEDGEIKNVTEPVNDEGIKTVTDEFTYEVKLWRVDEDGNKSAVYTFDDQIKEDGSATISGSVGYRIFSEPSKDENNAIVYGTTKRGAVLAEDSPYASLANGIFATITKEETTIVLTMPANGEIRLVNLPLGTKYSVREIVDADGNYNYAATKSQVNKGGTVSEGTVSTGNIVTGSVSGNSASIETYYNWAANFYVYHSSNNKIEKISFTDERVEGTYDAKTGYTYTFNMVNETAEDYLYGGYYKAYKNAAMTNDAIKAATYEKDANDKLWLTDKEGTPYDASKANIWKKAEAYTETVEETGGGIGTGMSPVANNVYYLKEVPNGYIRPYIHFTYDEVDPKNPLKKMYVITASDDTNYKSVGYVVAPSKDVTKAETQSLVISVKKPDGTIDATLTAKSIWDAKEYHGGTVTLKRGYLHWSDFSSNIGKSFTFQPCWNTLDGVLVKGVTVRTVNDGSTADTIGVSDVAAAKPDGE